MSLFNLFKKSEWSKLKEFDPNVQQDIAYLIALDALVKYGVRNAVDKFVESINSTNDETKKALCSQLVKQDFVNELELALLSTGVGKVFPEIGWNKVGRETVVKLLGILVMCQFRNHEQLTVENDITKSGFSYISNEARAQFLILLSNAARVEDAGAIKLFDIEHFKEFWLELKKLVFVSLQKNVAAEARGLTSVVRERFETLSKPRQETLLLLAGSLTKKSNNSATARPQNNTPSATPSPAAPFDAEKHKLEHPYLYIPHPKVSRLIADLNKKALNDFKSLGVDEYELRRVADLKNEIPSAMLGMIIFFDLAVLSYCATVAVIQSKEPKFVGCGVWKAVTEKFQKENILQFSLMAGFKSNGMLDVGAITPGGHAANPAAGLDLVNLIRGSAREFLQSGADSVSRLKVLTKGTVAICGLLSHPKYSASVVKFVDLLFIEIEQVTTELSKGELLAWDKQKELT